MKKLICLLLLFVAGCGESFAYKEKVYVKSGFYKNQRGQVVSESGGGTSYGISTLEGETIYVNWNHLARFEDKAEKDE